MPIALGFGIVNIGVPPPAISIETPKIANRKTRSVLSSPKPWMGRCVRSIRTIPGIAMDQPLEASKEPILEGFVSTCDLIFLSAVGRVVPESQNNSIQSEGPELFCSESWVAPCKNPTFPTGQVMIIGLKLWRSDDGPAA